MVPPPKPGNFSPTAAQALHIGVGPSHSPHPSQANATQISAGASPSTVSPTGTSSLSKIVVAQIYLLLSSIKDDSKSDQQVEQIRKLLQEHGMEVYSKYITRLIAGNAGHIFPGVNRPSATTASHQLLVTEIQKVTSDPAQASKIAESIEMGTEDIFRDFDLASFIEHFNLNPLGTTILALAFRLCSRADLPPKADAILAKNFSGFCEALGVAEIPLDSDVLSLAIDRYLHIAPPHFTTAAKDDLEFRIRIRYGDDENPGVVPPQILAAFDLTSVLSDDPANGLVHHICRFGAEFTKNEESCLAYLRNATSAVQLSEDQVAAALKYTAIAQTPVHNPAVLVSCVRRLVSSSFQWQNVVSYFDQPGTRVSSEQFLRLYQALVPIAHEQQEFDITSLWGGGGREWQNKEALNSFITAFISLWPEQLDATTIPRCALTFSLDICDDSPPAIQEQARHVLRCPLSSSAAIKAIFTSALSSNASCQTAEARRLFTAGVVPNLSVFMISALHVPRDTWSKPACETVNGLFDNYLRKICPGWQFVFHMLWKLDKTWVIDRLAATHKEKHMGLLVIFPHVEEQGWLAELVSLKSFFAYDLAAFAHSRGKLTMTTWANAHADDPEGMAKALVEMLTFKANAELQYQRSVDPEVICCTTPLQVRTVWALLRFIEDTFPKAPHPDLIKLQRDCVTVYPRLINYGEGFDDIIDANGLESNQLPPEANVKMEEHYKKMYSSEVQVREVVDILGRYKRSRDRMDQEIFACMIHGLFDEYLHFGTYPLEALATTAVLFGAIISHKLISDLPLQIGLGMILDAVKDNGPEVPMFKFGLQALMQILGRFREWPGYCRQLVAIPGLQNTEAYREASRLLRPLGAPEESFPTLPPVNPANSESDATASSDVKAPPFVSICPDPLPSGVVFEEPEAEVQGKIMFCLNNLTENTLETRCEQLTEVMDRRYHEWFANCLVDQRAKTQPNYHAVYAELLGHLRSKELWAQILRGTYMSALRILNSETTLTNIMERNQLKNLGGWLGLITLARNKPIPQRNISFKELLIEAHDTKRLIIVIPFVCKILGQAAKSKAYRPPNPWLMDIVRLLIELYFNAELKLNLKFEIEVLCKDLDLDYNSIPPSHEITDRVMLDDVTEAQGGADGIANSSVEGYDGLTLNGMAATLSGTPMTHPIILTSIPELDIDMIDIPPTNDMVISHQRLRELVRTAMNRAISDIIQAVVERSVTIAAISTKEMIRKDFATEPDENRMRAAAINMVKTTAGSLALVTSKEPLRSNFTSYMRNSHSSEMQQQSLPDGTIMMCADFNLDYACSIIQKQAEERAVPEIEDMLQLEFQARQQHRAHRGSEPYVDPGLSRWALTIPAPYKLSPSLTGLNADQMSIYDNFARQPRMTASYPVASRNVPGPDGPRILASDVLQDSYNALQTIETVAADGPSLPAHLANTQLSAPGYMHVAPGAVGTTAASGRSQTTYQLDLSVTAERFRKFLGELQRVTFDSTETHVESLPRPHPVIDVADGLVQLVIQTQQSSEDFTSYAADHLCEVLLARNGSRLMIEAIIHVIESCRKVSSVFNTHVITMFQQQSGRGLLARPDLIMALLKTDLLDWRKLDAAFAVLLRERNINALELFVDVVETTLFNDNPIAFYADFAASFEVLWPWHLSDQTLPALQRFGELVTASRVQPSVENVNIAEDMSSPTSREQHSYLLDEWIDLVAGSEGANRSTSSFLKQLRASGIVKDSESFILFIQHCLDSFISKYNAANTRLRRQDLSHAVAKLIVGYSCMCTASVASGDGVFGMIMSTVFTIITATVYRQHASGDVFCQAAFGSITSALMHEIANEIPLVLDNPAVRDLLLGLALRFQRLGPMCVPGFVFGWLQLIQHRTFLPAILELPDRAGWAAFAALLGDFLKFIGAHFCRPEIPEAVRSLYTSALKLIFILHHDFPDFVSVYGPELAWLVPVHCSQIINALLFSFPTSQERADELQHVAAQVLAPQLARHEQVLEETGLLSILTAVLQNGPSEDAVANIAIAIQRPTTHLENGFGNIPVEVNMDVVNAVVWFIGSREASQQNKDSASPLSSGAFMLSLLVHELPTEARFCVLFRMMSKLRSQTDPETHYFSRLVLNFFESDVHDHEEMEIREHISRIFFERLLGHWPQPWGLTITFSNLATNKKYMFFEMPFVKANTEIAERFVSITQRNQLNTGS